MSRQTRTLLAVAVLAIAGIVALAAVARRYASALPAKSVLDAPAADSAPRAAVVPGTAALEGFVAGRQAVKKLIDERPRIFRELLDEANDRVEGRERVRMHTFILAQLRGVRSEAAAARGLAEAGYIEIREQYRAWKSGGTSVDPAWRRVFEDHPELAASADLAEWDILDF